MHRPNAEADDSAHVAQAICHELSLDGDLTRFAAGSVPVFAVGDRYVVKLFPADERPFCDAEQAALARIDGRLSIPTPRLIGAGRRGRWLYVVMTQLHGTSLAETWPAIDQSSRSSLMRGLGAALAELHAVDAAGLAPLAIDWPGFIDAQRASCRDRQARKGLPAPWLDQIDRFLERWTPRDGGRRVLLHTEVMREHLLVERAHGTWSISGLLDFEPAMVGAPEYELASVGVFVTCAEPGLLRELLDSYGAAVDEELPLRIMAYALLHRYSNLRWYLDRLPVPATARDLEEIARGWFTP